jgi:hypothetical protein
MIELARPLDQTHEESPIARARLARQLTREEAARRAGLPEDAIEWLEEARVYRFPSADDALNTLLVYAASLGIDHREARGLAGLHVPPRPLEPSNRGRLLGLAALAAAVAVFVGFLSLPAAGGTDRPAYSEVAASLPPAWKVKVEVLNGSGDINWTRRVASRIGGLAYTIAKVGRADRFDYQDTAVYYEPGGQAVAVRLARQLGVRTRPLPGGADARRLLVIVGPRRGPGL